MKRIAFLFPGQGSQVIGMGKEIIENDKDSRALFERANEVLDFDLEEICFTEQGHIHQTAFTQPALLAVSIALLKAVEKMGIVPEVVTGLSLGEYTALVANGALDFEEAITLVRKRGLYMEEAAKEVNGSMAAVIGSSKEIIENICSQVDGSVGIANYNSPQQIVISGEVNALNEAIMKLKEESIKVIPINVSGAFHSELMASAASKLEKYMEQVTLKPFKVPYVTNVTGQYITEHDRVKSLLVEQVKSPVKWQTCIETMIDKGIDTFVEIGPGKTLAGLVRKIDRSKKVISVNDLASLEKVKTLLND